MSAALARFSVDDLPEPIVRPVVDSLSDVEAEVKASVVCASEHDHDLTLFVLSFVYSELRVFLFEVVGIDKGGFVPEKLLAGAKVLRKKTSSLFLDYVLVLSTNSIPEF